MELIKTLFPGWALKRQRAINEIEVLKRYYDAAKLGDQRKRPRSASSPQLVTQNGGIIVRDFARNLDENHDIAIGILDTLVNNIVGPSVPITPTVKNSSGELIPEVNEQIKRVFTDWKRRPEATRTLPFDQMIRLMCRAWLRDGEQLAQRVKGLSNKIQHHGVVPYTIENIESDFLPYDLNQVSPRKIIQGIEVNDWSQPVAFHLLKRQPSDFFNLRTRPDDVKRVEADNMFHTKFSRRLNQIRGVSILHGVITRLDDIKEYEESERIAARVAAAMTGFIKKSPEMSRSAPVVDDETNRTYEMSPGMIYTLQPGDDVGTISSDRPNPGIGDFRNDQLRAAASGTGTNHSSISKNFDGSYSSQRQSLVDSSPSYTCLFNYFAEVLIRPIYDDFISMAIASGTIRIPQKANRETLHDVEIRGVAMPWIDPKKEVEADGLSVKYKFESRHNIIRKRGGDPQEIDKEIEADPVKVETKEQVDNEVTADA